MKGEDAVSIEEKAYPAPPEYEVFKKRIQELTGIDLNAYKFQIHRRVHMLMQRWNVTSYDEYYKVISTREDKLREFLDYLTINVSEFFRNANRWWELKDKVFPLIFKETGQKKLKLWSAGCATGEEPYSLGVLALETGLTNPQPVLATDIDRGALAKAQAGIFQKRQLVNAPPEWISKYFSEIDANTVQVKNVVKEKVNFRQQNLIKDPFDSGMDVILCRNVVIYFSPETKSALYEKFFNALRPGGYLMTGSTEQIFEYKKIGFESAGPFLYRKPR
ncbi:CheR family methyltransferase [Aminomonas paucivorans]|uniref:protein-glutamate O-methyltransferase n=1 Tax=Aminomonas paucivorans DSM 12260 TaxID=584708 RepID=E3D111_9BACT|nr:protein-glutamate O-methyltransferase CheR [Aminomonas paucivorans]EFQ23917.1 MCP methyltransferase, CheR-type [Aminomonas paucivorans DSM 12260]